MEPRPKRKQNIFVRLLLFLVSAAVVLSAAAVVVFHDQLNLDALKRWFTYRSLSLNDSGQADSFHCGGSADDIYLDLDGDLLVCGANSISLYSGSGTQYVDQAVDLSSPAASVGGGAAVIYDAGGTQLYVLRQRALAFSMESEGRLLSARLSESGLLTVVSQRSGYRGVATVYNADFRPIANVQLSSAYIMDAQLFNDGHSLAVVTISQTDGNFISTLSVYDLGAQTQEISYDVTPSFSCDLGGSVILELAHSGGRLWAMGDRELFVLDEQASVLGRLSLSDRYLKAYSLAGDGFAAVLLGRYRAGAQSELSVLNSDGTLPVPLPLDEQVLSVSAAGRYFAVLTADRLDIYTRDMALYSTLSGTHSARKVLLREDGSAILVATGTARLYVPS